MKPVRPLFWWLSRIAVAAIFLGACIAKIRDPAAFALSVYRYRILPDALINLVAIWLPWIELLTGIAILLPARRLRGAAAFLISGMLAVFTVAISLNLLRGIEASCGCFSTRADAAVSDHWNLVRNASLLWLSAAIWLESWNLPLIPRRGAPPRKPAAPPKEPA